MRFQEILGQDVAISQLKRAHAHHRLSHAYIFDGPRGVGKMTTARALAALLLCEAPQGDDACGQCDACRQLVVGTHPDCIIVEPDGKSIKIKQIRDLRARLFNTASYGGYTVVLIDDADTMGIEAANAFLKTVEEPVGPTCFVLVTTHADRLPDTIRSRAQLVRFKSLSEANILRLLGRDDEDARMAVDLANGSLAQARAILEDDDARMLRVQRKRELETLLKSLSITHDGALLRFSDAFNGDRDAVREEILLIRRHYRHRLNQALSDGTDLSRPIHILHQTTTALERLETNTESSLILGALLIEMARALRQ